MKYAEVSDEEGGSRLVLLSMKGFQQNEVGVYSI